MNHHYAVYMSVNKLPRLLIFSDPNQGFMTGCEITTRHIQAGIRAYQRGDSTTLIIFIGIVVVTILVYYFKDKK